MKVATLSSSLLARKGAARPTISEPVGAARPIATLHEPASSGDKAHFQGTPLEIDDAPSGSAHDRRVRISLRLDPVRHRRLRLAAVHLDRSLQDILTSALDRYVDGLGVDCVCMETGATNAVAHRSKTKEGNRS